MRLAAVLAVVLAVARVAVRVRVDRARPAHPVHLAHLAHLARPVHLARLVPRVPVAGATVAATKADRHGADSAGLQAPGGADMAARNPVPGNAGVRRQRTPYPVVQHLTYPGLDGTIILENADEVLSALNDLMTGWVPKVTVMHPESGASEPAAFVSMVRCKGSRMNLHSPWLDAPLERLQTASAACGVVADISQAFCNQQVDCLGLHCGAVQINECLVVLTGPARAGKSTLMSRLSAEADMIVFCDDILPVLSDGLAFGLGLAPRLRLPLPDGVSDAFRAHVAAFLGPSDRRYGYLCGPNIAPHGTRAALGALIVLDRGADCTARLHRMEATEAVQHLVRQNIAAPGEGTAHFDQVTRMAESLPCLKLVYSDLEEAVALLRKAFGAGGLAESGIEIAPSLPAMLDPVIRRPALLGQFYLRSPQVAVRLVQDDLFLWHAAEHSYFHLNPVARAIWTLLETPITGAEIADMLAVVFPDADPDRIAADVAALLGAFETEFLIQPSD